MKLNMGYLANSLSDHPMGISYAISGIFRNILRMSLAISKGPRTLKNRRADDDA
jgi:hypothetical protein